MPVDWKKYPADWKRISHWIRFERAQGVCEGLPGHEPCGAVHGERSPYTGARVILTTAHLDHDTTNNDPANLRALCQRCHNRWDAPYRAANRRRRTYEKNLPLF